MAKDGFLQSLDRFVKDNAALFAGVSRAKDLWAEGSGVRDKMTEFFTVIANGMIYGACRTGVPINEVLPTEEAVGYMESILWRVCRAWEEKPGADSTDKPDKPLDIAACLFLWSVFEWLAGQEQEAIWKRYQVLVQQYPFCAVGHCCGHGGSEKEEEVRTQQKLRWKTHWQQILKSALEKYVLKKEDLPPPWGIPRVSSPHIFVIRQAWHLREDVSPDALSRVASVTTGVTWPAWVGASKISTIK